MSGKSGKPEKGTGAPPTPQQRLARLARLVPAGDAGTAARTPFVVLVVLLLGSGLLSLLLLNASVNQGSFELSELERRTEELTDEEQALEQELDSYSDPGTLAERAREMGLVPGGNPVFILPDGTVRGVPLPAPGGESGTGEEVGR
ncbi:septum formation initiator family protein [Streptomyces macrosporus]|uniref:Septum formation initiator family protein n=1 Tax=Streptomyces macrosporus TaxID=44032 RepID=A0ABP5X740_9ACTN